MQERVSNSWLYFRITNGQVYIETYLYFKPNCLFIFYKGKPAIVGHSVDQFNSNASDKVSSKYESSAITIIQFTCRRNLLHQESYLKIMMGTLQCSQDGGKGTKKEGPKVPRRLQSEEILGT